MGNFGINRILLSVCAISLIIGVLDYFRGNRWKLGERFLAGIRAFEPLFLTMAGILVLIPLFSSLFKCILPPVCNFLRIDPSIFAGLFLANDMGAYPLAHSLSGNAQAADFSGMLLGSVFGVNLVFTIPAALKMMEPQDRGFLFQGVLVGFCTIPVGCFLGGLSAGYPASFMSQMLIPIVIVALLSITALLRFPEKLSRFLGKLGRALEAIALLGIVSAIVSELTGISSREYLAPIQNGIDVVGSIIIVLPGAYVFVALLDKLFHSLWHKVGTLLGINEIAVLGLITTLANSIPTLQMLKDMDNRGKVMNAAFLTAGAFCFGDHLAFCYAVAPHLTLPLLVTKLTAAVTALLLANWLWKFRFLHGHFR